MRRQFLFVILGTGLLLGSAPDAPAQGKGGGKTPPPLLVTSTVHDTPGATLQSDGLGPYTATGGILSQIYSQSGDWAVDLREQTTRKVFLSFFATQPPVGSGPYPTAGLYNARVLSRCFDDDTIEGFFAIAPGQSNTTCSLRIGFTFAGVSYALVSSPRYAGTNWATVACVAPASPTAPCTGWTITPGSNPDPLVTVPRAGLYRVAKNGNETLVGFYELRYAIDVTAP